MKKDAKRKVAVITGGATGIGFAIAKKFTENNIMTVIIGRDVDKLNDACNKLGELSDKIAFDITILDQIPVTVQKIINEYGKIDILVNNAGMHLKKPLEETSDDEYQKVILTNQTAVFSMTRCVAEFMHKCGSGAILNISSMASIYGIPSVMAYTASKAAIEGMTRAMAVELSPLGIRVNCIAPGFIKTDMSSSALDNDIERKKRVLSRTPLGRLGKPDEVANAALFLVSDAASFITGAVLPVDGGNSIGF